MKIELKKINVAEHLSEETTAFTAEIYVDGKNVGYARNSGRGGSTDCSPYPEHRELFKSAEQHCLSLPARKFPSELGMKAFEIPMDLEQFVDQAVENHLKEKDKKKLEKKMSNHIMWGIPGGTSYVQIKFSKPLSQIPLIQLQVYVNQYKKEFTEGQQFLNTNLEALGVKL